MDEAAGLSRLPVAKPFFLSETVPYRAQQVLSQNFYRKDGDAVTTFSFEAGEGISREVLDDDCLYWVLEGEVVVFSGDYKGSASTGDCMAVPAGTAHGIDMLSRSKIMVVTVGSPVEKDMTMIKNINKSEVVVLRDLVAIEKDKVSSITLAQKDNLTVTVFAFDANTGIGAHSSDGDAMVNAIDGEGEITIGDVKYTLKAGESIVMPAGIPHAVNAKAKTFKMLLVVIKP